jgi:hypothetical protein
LYHGPQGSSADIFVKEQALGPVCYSLDPKEIVSVLMGFMSDVERYRRSVLAGREVLDHELNDKVMDARFLQLVSAGSKRHASGIPS